MSEAVVVTTGVTTDNYEFLWKIQHFNLMLNDSILRENQKFVIHTGKHQTLQSTWEVGIKNVGSTDRFHVYCKLVNITSRNQIEELPVCFTVEFRRVDEVVQWTSFIQRRVKQDEVLDLHSNYWWDSSTIWHGFLDTETGTLTLLIRLTLLNPIPPEEPDVQAMDLKLGQLAHMLVKCNLGRILTKKSANIKIICSDGIEILSHKELLKGNSPVFQTMLKPNFTEAQTGIIKVEDISSKTMEALLHYMLTGELLPTWKDSDTIAEFIYVVGKYEVPHLLQYLDQVLVKHASKTINWSNILALVNVSSKLGMKTAEKQLVEKFVKMAVNSKSSAEVLSFLSEST